VDLRRPNLSKNYRLISPLSLLLGKQPKKDKIREGSPSQSHALTRLEEIIIMHAVASSAKVVVAPTMRMQNSQTKRVVAKVPVKASSFNVEKVRLVVL